MRHPAIRRGWFVWRLAVMAVASASCQAKLEVTPPEPAAIAIAVSSSTVSLRPGTTSTPIQVVLSRNTTATQPVQLGLIGLPPGVRVTLTPSTMLLSDRTASLELLATATATPGSSLLTLKAESGTLSVSAQIGLTIQP